MTPGFTRSGKLLLVGLLLLAGQTVTASPSPGVQQHSLHRAPMCCCGAPGGCCCAACRCSDRSPAPLSSVPVIKPRDPADGWLEMHIQQNCGWVRCRTVCGEVTAQLPPERTRTTLRLLEVRLNV